MTENTGRAVDFDEDFDEEDEDTQKGRFLSFNIANESYGIGIEFVTEIIGIQKITEVPEMPDFIMGLINLRGMVIPIMDIRLRFKMQQRDYDDRTCIIIVNIQGTSIGLIVDKVSEVISIPEEGIQPPPQTGQVTNRYISGIGKIDDEVRILLDVNNLLFDEELKELQTAADQA